MSVESLLGGPGGVAGGAPVPGGLGRGGPPRTAGGDGGLAHLLRRCDSVRARATLGISERTLVRRKREGTLSSEESAKLVRVARVVARAEEVFEDFDAALDWLKSPNAAIGGVTPFSLLDTDIGAESVFDTLGRIEHGVYA